MEKKLLFLKKETEGTRWRFWRFLRQLRKKGQRLANALSISVTQSFHFFHSTLTERLTLNPYFFVPSGAFSVDQAVIFSLNRPWMLYKNSKLVAEAARKENTTSGRRGRTRRVGAKNLIHRHLRVVRVPAHRWRKEPLKKSELGKGRSGRTRLTSAVRFEGCVFFSPKAFAFVHYLISLNECYIVNLGFWGIILRVQNWWLCFCYECKPFTRKVERYIICFVGVHLFVVVPLHSFRYICSCFIVGWLCVVMVDLIGRICRWSED